MALPMLPSEHGVLETQLRSIERSRGLAHGEPSYNVFGRNGLGCDFPLRWNPKTRAKGALPQVWQSLVGAPYTAM